MPTLSTVVGKQSMAITTTDVHCTLVHQGRCLQILKSLKSVEDISCEREAFDAKSGTGSFLIVLKKYPLKPQENNLYSHNGNPPIGTTRTLVYV
jgi:hypothetical protein